MKKLIIRDYYTNEILAKKSLTKAEGKSISYRVEIIGQKKYMVVRDYNTGDILHKFKKTGSKWDRSITFAVEH